jgi:ABC-type transport system involved in cytochrome c biogenesis permease subunit
MIKLWHKGVLVVVAVILALTTILNKQLCGGGLGENLLKNACDGRELVFLGYSHLIKLNYEAIGVAFLIVMIAFILIIYYANKEKWK